MPYTNRSANVRRNLTVEMIAVEGLWESVRSSQFEELCDRTACSWISFMLSIDICISLTHVGCVVRSLNRTSFTNEVLIQINQRNYLRYI